MGVRKKLHKWMYLEGFTYNKGDNSYSKRLSDTFSIEVDKDLSVFISCTTDVSETDMAHIQVDFHLSLMLIKVERIVTEAKAAIEKKALENNVNALLKMTGKQ